MITCATVIIQKTTPSSSHHCGRCGVRRITTTTTDFRRRRGSVIMTLVTVATITVAVFGKICCFCRVRIAAQCIGIAAQ